MSLFDKLTDLGRPNKGAGKVDRDKSAYWTTPWSWRDDDGCYVGYNGEVWLYRELELTPIEWEDPQVRLGVAGPLNQVLQELGSTSKDVGGGVASLSRNRDFHLVSLTWEAPARAPAGTPDELAEYLDATFDFPVPVRSLLVGVKLRSSLTSQLNRRSTGVKQFVEVLKENLTATLGEEVPNMAAYDSDRAAIDQIFKRVGGKAPRREALNHLESWYNHGRGPDCEVLAAKDVLWIDRAERLEFAAVLRFEDAVMHAPDSQWALDALTHPTAPSVVSIRGELQPSTVARARMRRSQRKVMAQIEEEEATGDLEKAEYREQLAMAQQVEDWVQGSREPLITECSIVMGRRAGSDQGELYIDELRDVHGIIMKPLEWRQLDALDETLPCSAKRTGQPFHQDVSISMLAYAGLQGFSKLGDPTGVYVGLCDPDWTPVYINPLGAPAANLPPAMGIFGDPGSGKTWLASMIVLQATLAGMPSVLINPKGFDTLASIVHLVQETLGEDAARVVSLTKIEEEGGYFDPFRYADPDIAAEIAATHILSVMVGFTEAEELALSYGLKRGAEAGAKCVFDALQHLQDEHPTIVERVMQQVHSSNTFALGIGLKPREQYTRQNGLTLIEFDRKLDLPDPSKDSSSYTRAERIALAAMRIVTRASLETLARSGGGILAVDEAHHFLSQPQGLAALQQIGREGRSLNILPIFITQRIADLLEHDLEGYLSRVFVMKLMEEREATAALKLCGLEATPNRIAWLRNCGPRPQEGDRPAQPAIGLHRDLRNRHSAVLIGPVPPTAAEAFSTNPEDRARRKAEQQRSLHHLEDEADGGAELDTTDSPPEA